MTTFANPSNPPLLIAKNLSVRFGDFPAVDGIDLEINAGEVLGIVGESGSGKSVTSLAIMGLIEAPGRVGADTLMFNAQGQSKNLLTLTDREHRRLLGRDIAMVFQDPMTSLNPCFTIAFQLIETLRLHEGGSRQALQARALELLQIVEIPDAKRRLHCYPHELSGGMCQRVMVAMAIACHPKLLIADEPTTALDVTIQAQIMKLLLRLQREQGMALILITHDLGLVAEAAKRVMVMYAGKVMENAPVPDIFENPHHPYTRALMAALPENNLTSPDNGTRKKRLQALGGVVPGAHDRPRGCLLSPRCAYAQENCRQQPIPMDTIQNHQVRCLYPRLEPWRLHGN